MDGDTKINIENKISSKNVLYSIQYQTIPKKKTKQTNLLET